MNIWLAGLVAALGNVAGSTLLYFIGLKGGRPILQKYGKRLRITEERFNTVERWFSKWGDELVFFAK